MSNQEKPEITGIVFSKITESLPEVAGFRALVPEQQKALLDHLRLYARLINSAFASSNPSEDNRLPSRRDHLHYIESYNRTSNVLGGSSWSMIVHSEQIVAAVMISDLRWFQLKEKEVVITEAKSDAYIRTLQEGGEHS